MRAYGCLRESVFGQILRFERLMVVVSEDDASKEVYRRRQANRDSRRRFQRVFPPRLSPREASGVQMTCGLAVMLQSAPDEVEPHLE